MKRLFYFSLLGLVTLFASCVKEDPPVPVGEARVRFVNAVDDTIPQNMFINGIKVPNSVPLSYGSFSPYTKITSGDNAYAFANPDVTTGIGSAGIAGQLEIGDNASVYYIRKLKSATEVAAAVYLDNVTPAEGKVKVRLIHLNSNLNNFINFSVVDGDNLSPGISFLGATTYFEVEPGSKFVINGSTLTEPFIIDQDLKAGKNYTIWIDGPSEKELRAHFVLEN